MEPVKPYRIFLATFVACIPYFSLGTAFGWTSPVMPKLREVSESNPLGVTISSTDEGWIGSTLLLGGLTSSVISGTIGKGIGPRYAILLSSCFLAVGYILAIFGDSVIKIVIARLLQGFGGGILCTSLPTYVAEISTDDCRGATGSTSNLFMIGGIIYVFSIGSLVEYTSLQYFCLAVPVLSLVTFCLLPESPYFLAMKGHRKDGIKSLKFLRGQKANVVEHEMNQIQNTVDESLLNTGTLSDIFKNRGYRKALLISCGLLSFQQLSGTTAVTFNSETIFRASKSSMDPAIASVLLMVVQLVFSAVALLIVDRVGRKIILLISAAGMCLTLFILGIFFYIQTYGDASRILWLPLPILITFFASLSIGFGPIPWAILGEIFPSNIKTTASSIATSSIWLTTFIVTLWFPELNALGPHYAFWIFGALCLLAFLFVYFVVIETKGLTLNEIQHKLSASKNTALNSNDYKVVSTQVKSLEEVETKVQIQK